jgi:hypothetical protein
MENREGETERKVRETKVLRGKLDTIRSMAKTDWVRWPCKHGMRHAGEFYGKTYRSPGH